jgi:hypothetical protein
MFGFCRLVLDNTLKFRVGTNNYCFYVVWKFIECLQCFPICEKQIPQPSVSKLPRKSFKKLQMFSLA